MAGIDFKASKMRNNCTSEALYISTKSNMTIEESHCQATKTPNRRFVNARYLWVEGHTTLEESHYQAAKIPNRGSVNTMGGGIHAP
jgi:recombination DNA repair RAD52 pathway protein